MNRVRGFVAWFVLVTVIAGITLIFSHHTVFAQMEWQLDAPMQIPLGCFMAHCDSRMSDWAGMAPPSADAQIIWHDTVTNSTGDPIGSGRGLGCVANGTFAVCTFGRLPQDFPNTPCEDVVDTLVAYGYAGNDGVPYRMWGSGTVLNCAAFSSVPLVLASGSVVAADNERIVRFDTNGNLLWNTPTPGGRPISLVLSDGGTIVMGTAGGPVSIYDIATGTMLASLDLIEDGGRYHTSNTPAVRGNRIYISTNHSVNPSSGRLYAIDMVSSGGGLPDSLQVAWYFEFNGPSGVSPFAFNMDMVYFDGDRDLAGADAPTMYAVRDLGASPQLLWTKAMNGQMEASFARDKRGGMWAYSVGNPPVSNRWLYRIGMYDSNGDGIGDVLEQIDLDALVGEPGVHVPSSAMTMAGTASAPVMIVGASAYLQGGGVSSSFVVAIDLNTRALLWKVQVPDNVSSSGQFPITGGAYGSRIFFTNQTNGTWVIGTP
ncbi:MAG: PQQ-binding-like beta-propeller repeat protein [Anaerolineales bacterium]|nr:PQQ-binding-like beta-propeller repeat protein [Anaerolineales bacterium]MCB8953949.1 PQQ-binding-like beta-propeller repeat protein [Ardenticatenales bacterium]